MKKNNTNKKINFIIFSIILIILLSVFSIKTFQKEQKVINVFNWGDYIDPSLIKDFEKESGYKVNYETYDSNESLYTKLKQNGTSYDVVFPSDFMVEKLRKEGLIKKIDKNSLKNFDNFSDSVLDKNFDPNNEFSIPYFWGTLGIVYDSSKIDKISSWDELWDKKFKNKILMVDSARDSLGFALIANNHSLNSKNELDINNAENSLESLKPNIMAILSDEMIMYMINKEAPIAITWSGQAEKMIEEYPSLNYIVPEEGSNQWIDNISIPSNSKNTKEAYEFINFITRKNNVKKNTDYVKYYSPFDKDKKIDSKKLETFIDLGNYFNQLYNDLFLEFKMS